MSLRPNSHDERIRLDNLRPGRYFQAVIYIAARASPKYYSDMGDAAAAPKGSFLRCLDAAHAATLAFKRRSYKRLA